MRRYSAPALCSVILMATLAGCCSMTDHPALRVAEVFEPIESADHFVMPYSMNLYSIYILRHDLNSEYVGQYIDWYLNNLNYPDKHGLTGSMYDYNVRGKKQVPTYDYDSVDSYAGTFLILLRDYYVATGDRDVLDANRDKIMDIAYLIPYLQDEDGLVRALPDQSEKFLMDNCEDYGGLAAFNELSGLLGWDGNEDYVAAQEEIKQGILERLYDDETGMFHWAVDGEVLHRSAWSVFYPDSYAQIFPILYGVIEPGSETATAIWSEFIGRYDPRAGYMVEPVQGVVIGMARERMSR